MTSDLEEFKKQVTESKNTKTITVKKNTIISYPCDVAGCGSYRCIVPLNYLNSIYGRTPNFRYIQSMTVIFQQDILAKTKTIFFQRNFSEPMLKFIEFYKNKQSSLQYKMVLEIDDYIWGNNELNGGNKYNGVPSYNMGNKHITEDIKANSIKIMSMMDQIVVSTYPLKDFIKNTLKIKVPVKVIKNTVASFLWGINKKPQLTTDITKPKIIYTGSPTHYSNELKMYGDFDNSWKDYLIKNIENDSITFVCLGGLPWFLEHLKDKIEHHKFIDFFRYPNLVKSIDADFSIGPLVYNKFNECKSDIKFIESCASGSVFIGNTFKKGKISPYDKCFLTVKEDCSVQDIENLFKKYCQKDFYNDIIEKQYSYLVNDNRYTESNKNTEDYLNILFK